MWWRAYRWRGPSRWERDPPAAVGESRWTSWSNPPSRCLTWGWKVSETIQELVETLQKMYKVSLQGIHHMFATCPDQGIVCWHSFRCPSTLPSPLTSFWNRLFNRRSEVILPRHLTPFCRRLFLSMFRSDLTSSFMPSSWPALSQVRPGTLGKGLDSL